MVGGYEYKYGQIFATMIYKFALLQSYLAILQTKSTRSELSYPCRRKKILIVCFIKKNSITRSGNSKRILPIFKMNIYRRLPKVYLFFDLGKHHLGL